ncbi:zinc finger CCCH domain-containing protein 25 [Mercurialis annua]|uniref:zinc finger CCCH domain-containing protein 25 n=1 Tax=Mercurialis annua TaxID=3986 RepID=UPI00215DF36F|nr:zinc finger CCCH domain-containing protein 25 [Mercurialis annua]
MNPLTLVKRIQSINSKEAELGISEEASWHAKYKDSAYVFVGGIPFDLTEGDLLAVFAQCGEIVDVNLVRDKGTGKSKGFAFVAYDDQRSTILAVDNLNGAEVAGRTIRVDHVSKYKKKEEEDEETQRQKREARGVCRSFQRGECTRGASCKFSHDEQRAANTGWGAQDNGPRWGHDNFEGSKKSEKRFVKDGISESHLKQSDKGEDRRFKRHDANEIEKSREDYHIRDEKRLRRQEDDEFQPKSRGDNHRGDEKRPRRHADDELEANLREDYHRRDVKRLSRDKDYNFEPKSREDDYTGDERIMRRRDTDGLEARSNSKDNDHRREEQRLKRHESGSYLREDDKRAREKGSSYGREYTTSRHRERDERCRPER